MPSMIDPQDLFEWCRIPAGELENHPDAKIPIRILPTPDDVYREFARTLADEIKANNAEGKPSRLILPCGPRGEYPYFIGHVNEERISLKNVHVFHMDEVLDWQGRSLPLSHPWSFQGWMNANFYAPIDPELAIPEDQRYWPDPCNIDAISAALKVVGGADSVHGGIGYRGHIAYNEPPLNNAPWHHITNEEFRNSKTRVLVLNDDTIVALSQRGSGGCAEAVPPMAITMGMKDMLEGEKIRLYSETGAWKQTIIRILLFGPVTAEYPVTFVQEHPDALVTVDEATAASPPV